MRAYDCDGGDEVDMRDGRARRARDEGLLFRFIVHVYSVVVV